MSTFDPLRLALSTVLDGTRADPPLLRLHREGVDTSTREWLDALLNTPAAAPLRIRAEDHPRDFAGLVALVDELSAPDTALQHGELDVETVLALAHRPGDAQVGRALSGLLVLARIEGLARRYKPDRDYAHFSVRMIDSLCVPIARELRAAGAYEAAATMARLLRQYVMCDPAQRQSDGGRAAIAACRRIEAERDGHVHECCQHAALRLHRRMDDIAVRLHVAALLFALGDPLRARSIVRGEHRPTLAVLVELVEVGVELAPVDPLLQAVWLATLGDVGEGIPDDVRFRLRQVAPERNSIFKSADAAAKDILGMSYSQAYVQGVLGFISGTWDEHITDQPWWRVLISALELPVWDYRSGFIRLLELFSLATEPGTTLPNSELVSALAGAGATPSSDLREVAALSLRADQWTAQRGQLGRSLAYDSAFLIEPWHREEPVSQTIALLERHRHASLEYWLTVVPPLTEPPSVPDEQRVVEEDRAITQEYRALTFLGTLDEAPVYVRVYGEPAGKRLLRVDESERLQRLRSLDERRRRWYEDAAEAWPEYAQARMSGQVVLTEVGALLGIG